MWILLHTYDNTLCVDITAVTYDYIMCRILLHTYDMHYVGYYCILMLDIMCRYYYILMITLCSILVHTYDNIM